MGLQLDGLARGGQLRGDCGAAHEAAAGGAGVGVLHELAGGDDAGLGQDGELERDARLAAGVGEDRAPADEVKVQSGTTAQD